MHNRVASRLRRGTGRLTSRTRGLHVAAGLQAAGPSRPQQRYWGAVFSCLPSGEGVWGERGTGLLPFRLSPRLFQVSGGVGPLCKGVPRKARLAPMPVQPTHSASAPMKCPEARGWSASAFSLKPRARKIGSGMREGLLPKDHIIWGNRQPAADRQCPPHSFPYI